MILLTWLGSLSFQFLVPCEQILANIGAENNNPPTFCL